MTSRRYLTQPIGGSTSGAEREEEGVPNCRGSDTEIFYNPHTYADASKLCKDCPVKLQCRIDFATDPYAYAGGMTPGQRLSWSAESPERRAQARAKAREAPRGYGPRPKISEDKVAAIVRVWHRELIGSKAIAEELDLHKSTVQRVLREAGLRRTDEEKLELAIRGGTSGQQQAVRDRNDTMVMQLLGEGLAPKKVAELSGLTVGHVYTVRRRNTP